MGLSPTSETPPLGQGECLFNGLVPKKDRHWNNHQNNHQIIRLSATNVS
jgi:hypothetical protein